LKKSYYLVNNHFGDCYFVKVDENDPNQVEEIEEICETCGDSDMVLCELSQMSDLQKYLQKSSFNEEYKLELKHEFQQILDGNQ